MTPVRSVQDGKDFVPEFETHQPRCRKTSPVFRGKVRVRLRERSKRSQEGAGLFGSDRFRITIAKHAVRIGSDTSIRERRAEVPDPGMEAAKRGRNTVAWPEQAEDTSLGAAFSSTMRKPSRSEKLGNDTVNRRKEPLPFALEEASPERIRSGFGEREVVELCQVRRTIGSQCPRTCEDTGPIAKELCGTDGAGSEEKLFVASMCMPIWMVVWVILDEHDGAGTL